ncbi:hypothetical protein C8Q77DRAFT_1217310 [Trametes polyzona]|nr:hypothetical protein C8Q77DRAFT_1217310 [Trametes polyzona]
MTLNILVSFSLLALVVTARPISDAPQSVRKSLQVQNAVQAILASRTGQRPDYLAHDSEQDVHISLTSDEEQSAFLSRLEDLDAIKAVIPLNVDGAPSEDEKQLYDILKSLQNTGSSLDDLDGGERPLHADVVSTDTSSSQDPAEAEDTSPEYTTAGFPDLYTSPPLIVIAVSCIVAFLSMLCIGAGLYALNHLKSFMLKSDLAWDILPRLERRVGLDGPDDIDVGGNNGTAPLPEKRRLLSSDVLLPLPLVVSEKLPDDLNEKALGQDPDSDGDEPDEKFEDAPEHSLLFLDPDLPPQYEQQPGSVPRIIIDSHPDPDFLPLPEHPQSTPFATPLRSPLANPSRSPARHALPPQMREVSRPSSPTTKPLWSLRAADAPVLGLTSSSSSVPSLSPTRVGSPTPQLPGALFADDAPELMVEVPKQTRPRPRQPLDIAFALQLRPGLGIGADSAWLVRFLMAMFGWMTVLIGGGGARREDVRRTLTA